MIHISTPPSYLGDSVMRSVKTSTGLSRPPAPFELIVERQLSNMTSAFSRHGGMAAGDEVAMRMRHLSDQPISMLARWIVDRVVLSVNWKGQTTIPLFQFDPRDMSPRSEAIKVINELTTTFDDWELAVWFSQPNVWLDYRTPVDALLVEPNAVLQVARADRFVAHG